MRIFPRADFIRTTGIIAPFPISQYNPSEQLIQPFRQAYGQHPTAPVCPCAPGTPNVQPPVVMLSGAGTHSQFAAPAGQITMVAAENPVVANALTLARQAGGGHPVGTDPTAMRAAMVLSMLGVRRY